MSAYRFIDETNNVSAHGIQPLPSLTEILCMKSCWLSCCPVAASPFVSICRCVFDVIYFIDGGVLLTEEEVASARAGGRTFLLSWAQLAAQEAAAGIFTYKMHPKGHYVDHILEHLETGKSAAPQ